MNAAFWKVWRCSGKGGEDWSCGVVDWIAIRRYATHVCMMAEMLGSIPRSWNSQGKFSMVDRLSTP